MAILFQSHSGREKEKGPSPLLEGAGLERAGPPAGTDIAVDEQADFGYFVPPLDAPENYLPASPATIDELDALGNHMIDAVRFGLRKRRCQRPNSQNSPRDFRSAP